MTITGPRQVDAPRLHRSLGLWSVTLSGVGIVLGAGIYVLVGEASGEAGGATWLAFLLAAVLAGLTGLSFAELAAMFPEAGASASFVRAAFGARAGFLVGWLAVAVNVIGAAAVALGFGGYLEGLTGWDHRALALAAIGVCALVTYVGVGETVGIAMVFALAEVGGLLLVVVLGLPELGAASLLDSPRGAAGVLAAGALVFFAFEGFEQIASLAEETREPTRTIPRAIVLSIGFTAGLYVVVSMVATSVVPWEELSTSSAPLALVVEVAASERVGDGLSLVALFATFNTVLLLIATGARVIYGMANRRLLPSVLARVSSTRGTPWSATVLVAGVSSLFVFSGDIGFVAQVTNFAVFGQFLAVNGAVIVLRFTEAARVRPFRARASIGGVPVHAAVAIAGILVFAVFMEVEAVAAGVAALLLGLAVSFPALRAGGAEDEPALEG